MTSAAFAIPEDPQRRVSLRRRATNASTATSQAADEALQNVLDRRLRKRDGRPPLPGRQEFGGAAATIQDSVARLGLSQWLLRVAVLAGVAVVLGGAFLTLARGGSSSHSVAGTVLMGKTPLAQARLAFHRAAGGAGFEPLLISTGQDGSFRNPDDRPLPAGLYSVVIDSVGGAGPQRAPAVPALYRDPATTPLRVLVTEDLSGLRLLIRR